METLRSTEYPGIYESVDGGLEPLYSLDIVKGERRYWHQSGYGYLPESRVRVVAPQQHQVKKGELSWPYESS